MEVWSAILAAVLAASALAALGIRLAGRLRARYWSLYQAVAEVRRALEPLQEGLDEVGSKIEEVRQRARHLEGRLERVQRHQLLVELGKMLEEAAGRGAIAPEAANRLQDHLRELRDENLDRQGLA